MIRRVVDRYGREIYRARGNRTPVISEATAYLMTSMMADVDRSRHRQHRARRRASGWPPRGRPAPRSRTPTRGSSATRRSSSPASGSATTSRRRSWSAGSRASSPCRRGRGSWPPRSRGVEERMVRHARLADEGQAMPHQRPAGHDRCHLPVLEEVPVSDPKLPDRGRRFPVARGRRL